MSIPWGVIALLFIGLTAASGVYEIVTIRRAKARQNTAKQPDQAATASETAKPEATPLDQDERSVLIVEKDFASSQDFRAAIAKRHPGWRVTRATPTSLEVQLARSDDVDAVVVDLNIPNVEGQELVRQMRVTTLPVIYVSASPAKYTKVTQHEAFVQNALTSEEVFTALESAMEEKSSS